MLIQVSKGMKFMGGESAALGRVYEYFWKKVSGKNHSSYLYLCSVDDAISVFSKQKSKC